MFAVALCHKVGDRANGRFAPGELAFPVGRIEERRLRGCRLPPYIGEHSQNSTIFAGKLRIPPWHTASDDKGLPRHVRDDPIAPSETCRF